MLALTDSPNVTKWGALSEMLMCNVLSANLQSILKDYSKSHFFISVLTDLRITEKLYKKLLQR